MATQTRGTHIRKRLEYVRALLGQSFGTLTQAENAYKNLSVAERRKLRGEEPEKQEPQTTDEQKQDNRESKRKKQSKSAKAKRDKRREENKALSTENVG